MVDRRNASIATIILVGVGFVLGVTFCPLRTHVRQEYVAAHGMDYTTISHRQYDAYEKQGACLPMSYTRILDQTTEIYVCEL